MHHTSYQPQLQSWPGVWLYCCCCSRFALEAELRREGMPEEDQKKIMGELEKRESDYMRLQRQRLSADDFEPLTIIGRGAFGEVKAATGATKLAD
jgi:hypothetical protein